MINFTLNYVISGNDYFKDLIQCFDVMSQHQTLEQIKICIDNQLLNDHIFDKIIQLHNVKPNAQFEIEAQGSHQNNRLENYKTKYQQMKYEKIKHEQMLNVKFKINSRLIQD